MRFAPLCHALIAGALLLGSAPQLLAQDYPVREIRTMCPFAPGTGADIIVRFYASKLAEIAGKPVITENRAGAQGLLGTEAVAHAKPDGYTISINPIASTMAAAPHIFKHLSFDPLKDFEFGGTLMSVSFVLVVPPNTQIHTVADLTKYLKEEGRRVLRWLDKYRDRCVRALHACDRS
jgi:tripartite-type tricarboxylate transporter receptor subunit TctC